MDKYKEKTRKQLKQEIKDLKRIVAFYKLASITPDELVIRNQRYAIVPLRNKYIVPSTAPEEYVKRKIRDNLKKHLDEVIEYEKTYDDGVYKEIRATLHVLRKE